MVQTSRLRASVLAPYHCRTTRTPLLKRSFARITKRMFLPILTYWNNDSISSHAPPSRTLQVSTSRLGQSPSIAYFQLPSVIATSEIHSNSATAPKPLRLVRQQAAVEQIFESLLDYLQLLASVEQIFSLQCRLHSRSKRAAPNGTAHKLPNQDGTPSGTLREGQAREKIRFKRPRV